MPFSAQSLDLNTPRLIFEEDGVIGQRTILPGGVRVLTEKVPGQQSISLALWVGAGSRDEQPGHEGSTHFLEHLLFKGTDKRTASDISQLSDYLGGTLNAATARQYTNYYGRVFAGDLPRLLELLVDMVTHPTLSATDMETERGVILEELAAAEDDVVEVAETELLPLVYGHHPLARPIGGTQESVRALNRAQLVEHYEQYYRPAELVVTAAGAVDHEDLCHRVHDLLVEAGWQLTDEPPVERRRSSAITYADPSEREVEHPARQSAVVLGMPGITLDDGRNSSMLALEYILGGGVSSRMFQEIRERRGLAYSTYAYHTTAMEGGILQLGAQCAPHNSREVARIMRESLDSIAQHGVSQRELDIFYRQHRAQLIFATENNSVRRARLGRAELIRGELVSVAEELRRSRAVTAEQVQNLAQELLAGPQSLVIAGPR